MARAKAKKALTPEAERNVLREQIAADMNNPGDLGNPDPAPEPTVADLMKRLAELGSTVDSLKDQNALLMQAAPRAPVEITAPKPVSYEGLPDPTVNPKEYAEQLAERVRTNIREEAEYNQRLNAQQQEGENRIKAVFEDIVIAHPELAGKDERLDFAATQVLQRALRRGIDRDRYVFGNRNKFIEDVAKEYKETFGGAAPAEEDDDDDGRAVVISGEPGSSMQPREPGRQRAPQSGFTQEIIAHQKKIGVL